MNETMRHGSRDTVLFLSCWSTMGGAQVSLADILESLHGPVRTALAAPAAGPLIERVSERATVDEHVVIPSFLETSRPRARAKTAAALLRWLMRNHGRLQAVHANGDAEIKLLLPVLLFVWRPVVVWYHSREMAPGTMKMRLLWKLLGRRIRWATVSEAAREQLATAGIDRRWITVVPNPIDPAEISPTHAHQREHDFVFGYLGCEYESKGITVLPEFVDHLADEPMQLLCVTKEWPPDRNSDEVNRALDRLRQSAKVRMVARDFDVRRIYGQIDGLLIPSLSESFCRIAAEAMAIGLPVVASDIPAIREVTGDGAAAMLFPVSDGAAAAQLARTVATDPLLASRLQNEGRRIGTRFAPERVAEAFVALYGLGPPAD